MADIRDKKAKVFDQINAIRTLIEDFPKFKLPKISLSAEPIDFALDMFVALASYEQLKGTFVEILIIVLDRIEKAIKFLLKTLIRKYISCNVNPSVVNELISKGIDVTVDEFDITKLMKKNPLSPMAKVLYFDIPEDEGQYPRSKDFNVFMWWVVNKSGIGSANSWAQYSGEEIAQFTYKESMLSDEGKAFTDTVNMKVVGSYSSEGGLHIWNSNFIDSVQLYDSKQLIARIMGKVFGGLDMSLGLTSEQIVLEGQINKILDKCACEESEIDDSFFTFDTSAYALMLEDAEEEKRGNGGYKTEDGFYLNSVSAADIEAAFEDMGKPDVTKSEQKQILSDGIDSIVDKSVQGNGDINENDKVKLQLNIIKKMIKALVQELMNVILSPKVYFLLLLNLRLVGIKDQYTAIEFIKKNLLLVKDIISTIKDLILDVLMQEIKKLAIELGTKYAKKIAMDIMKKFKKTIEGLTPKANALADKAKNAV